MFWKKNLFIATAPNIQRDDIVLILRLILNPFNWKRGSAVEKFEKDIESFFNINEESAKAVAFDSARSSFYALLKSYGFKKGDEVLMPSFTCVVIVNSVIYAGLKPVYVDIDKNTFNIDFADLKKKVTKKTKAILVQHTFGLFVDIGKVRKIVGNDVKIIEDTAHILGGTIVDDEGKEKRIGILADAGILTFGIEKMMTSLRGGMVVVKDKEIYKKLKNMQKQAPEFSRFRIFMWLINPIVWFFITPLYYLGFGKFTIGRIFSKLGHDIGIMGNMVEKCEYKGDFPLWMPAKMPPVLAKLGRHQLRKLNKFNSHRLKIAKIYDKEFSKNYSKTQGYTPIRYPLLVKNPEYVHRIFKKEHIVLGNWYSRFLFTYKEFLEFLQFDPETAQTTKFVTRHIINLPTFIHVKLEDAKKIAKKLRALDQEVN